MKSEIAAGVLAFLLAAQSTPAGAIRANKHCLADPLASMNQVSLERFQDGAWSIPCVFLATSEEDWYRLTSEMEVRGELVFLPPPPPPRINWKKENVIVISLGQFPTNGYWVEIRSVTKKARAALLNICITIPSDPLRPQVLTFPYHMVQVAKTDLESVEVCEEAYEFTGPPNRNHQGFGIASFTNLTPPPPGGAAALTWGGLKTRYR